MVPSIDDILADDNLTSDQTLLLIVISRHAHADGTGAYPSLRRLAACTKFSLSHICTLLPSLEKTGYLTIERFKGPKGVNAYTLHAPQVLRSTEHLTQVRVPQELRRNESEVQAEEKNPVRVQEEELRTEVLRTEVLRAAEHLGARETLDPKAARWLEVNGSPGGIASQVCGLGAAAALPPPADAPLLPPPPLRTPRKFPFDAKRFMLGDPCPDDPTHRYGETGQSLRERKDQTCAGCTLAAKKATHRLAQRG